MASMNNNVNIASGCSGAPVGPVKFDLPGSSKTRRGKKRNAEAAGEPDFSPEKMAALLKKIETLEETVSQQGVDAESAEQQRKRELKLAEQKWMADLQTKDDKIKSQDQQIKTQDQQIEALQATKVPKIAAPPKTERELFQAACLEVAMHILPQNEVGEAVPFPKPNHAALSKGKGVLQGAVPPPDSTPVDVFALAQDQPLLRGPTVEVVRENVFKLAWNVAFEYVITQQSNRPKIVGAYILQMMKSGRIMSTYDDARQLFKELHQPYVDASKGAVNFHLRDTRSITAMILIKAQVPVDGEPMAWPGTPSPQSKQQQSKRIRTTGSAGAKKKNTPDKNDGSSNPSNPPTPGH